MSKALDARAIARIASDIQKASTDSATSPSTYSSLLSQLRTGVVASEELLRSTRIGIVVNRLKDVKDPDVRREAVELVTKWKTDINKHKAKGGASPRLNSSTANTTPPTKNGEVRKEHQVKHPEGMKGVETTSDAGEKWKSVKPGERTADKDGANYKITGTSVRDSCLKLMYDGLVKDSTLPPNIILPVAQSVETEVHSVYHPETSSGYKNKIRSLFSNMKTGKHLRDGLLGQPQILTPKRLVEMSPEELKSPEQAARDQALKDQNENNAKVGQEQKAISNFIQCSQCKLYKVSYSQAQTRSADEPMTTFCECTNCGKKWKFS